MPNLTSKARQGRINAIARLSGRRTTRPCDADRLFRLAAAMIETGTQPAPRNIFA